MATCFLPFVIPTQLPQGHWFGTFLHSLNYELVFDFLPRSLRSSLAKIKLPKTFRSAVTECGCAEGTWTTMRLVGALGWSAKNE